MTWEELKEKAKEMGYHSSNNGFGWASKRLDKNVWITLYKDGTVNMNHETHECSTVLTIAEHRTPEQMLMIMRGLE